MSNWNEECLYIENRIVQSCVWKSGKDIQRHNFFSIIMVTTDNERQVIRIITGTFFFLSRIESENKSEISKQKKK